MCRDTLVNSGSPPLLCTASFYLSCEGAHCINPPSASWYCCHTQRHLASTVNLQTFSTWPLHHHQANPMTILSSSDVNTEATDTTFATAMSIRRSARAIRRPKYYSNEEEAAEDETIASADHTATDSDDGDDVKPRKKIKSERRSSSISLDTESPSRRSTGSTRCTASSSSKSPSSPTSDEQYLLRRERNNVSVRKSRARVREATKAAVKCIDELTKEKNQLAKDQEILDGEISRLKKLIYHTFSPNPSTTGPIQSSSVTQEDHSYSSSQGEERQQAKIDLSDLKFFQEMVTKTWTQMTQTHTVRCWSSTWFITLYHHRVDTRILNSFNPIIRWEALFFPLSPSLSQLPHTYSLFFSVSHAKHLVTRLTIYTFLSLSLAKETLALRGTQPLLQWNWR